MLWYPLHRGFDPSTGGTRLDPCISVVRLAGLPGLPNTGGRRYLPCFFPTKRDPLRISYRIGLHPDGRNLPTDLLPGGALHRR
jgi:hypothetical protein